MTTKPMTSKGALWLADLMEMSGGDPLAVIDYLKHLTSALSVMVFKAEGITLAAAIQIQREVAEEVSLWMMGHADDYGGAEWLTAITLILAAVSKRAKEHAHLSPTGAGAPWEPGAVQ